MKYTLSELEKKSTEYNKQGGPNTVNFFLLWLNDQEHATEVDSITRSKLLWGFRFFFEGYDCDEEEVSIPIMAANINSMQIRDISFKRLLESIQMTISLDRPGLLIGKGGLQIDTLRKYLSDQVKSAVTINLVETNLWKA